jgi:hypothetical protein
MAVVRRGELPPRVFRPQLVALANPNRATIDRTEKCDGSLLATPLNDEDCDDSSQQGEQTCRLWNGETR